MKFKTFSVLFTIIYSISAYSFEGIIVKLKNPEASLTVSRAFFGAVASPEVLSSDLGLVKIEPFAPFAPRAVEDILAELRANPDVLYAQPDHILELRSEETTPDDKRFSEQWGLKNDGVAGINAPTAWNDFGTGGVTQNGEKIAVAVFDVGFNAYHGDVKGNYWVNPGEIAGNGVDDDNNGYKDDIHGASVGTKSGTFYFHEHGTAVAGVIGAQGNNQEGITGVNWDLDIMLVHPGSIKTTSNLIKGFDYILQQKKLWKSSQGQRGANIVAINLSLGIDRANCQSNNYKVWDDLFDSAGKLGVLSVAATANRGYDVDKVGDVPTTCQSEYLIGVSNITKKGSINSRAAWGVKNVDLTAPGTDILIASGNGLGSYKTGMGTSFATPLVTGAIAFMYSAASLRFLDLAKDQPVQAGLKIRSLLLETTRSLPSLKGKVATQGTLDLYQAAQAISRY